jgi:class 3 adenylate cyclase
VQGGAGSKTRKLAAILVADVVGYSRLAGADEDRTLARLRGLRSNLIDPAIAAHHGRVVKRTGDGSIIEFHSVLDATGWRHLIVRRTDSEQLHADTRRHGARSFVMVA